LNWNTPKRSADIVNKYLIAICDNFIPYLYEIEYFAGRVLFCSTIKEKTVSLLNLHKINIIINKLYKK